MSEIRTGVPDVTVIAPVYGVARYIGRFAASLFAQTWANVEFVFVDDCSPDESISLLRGVLERFPARKGQTQILRHDRNRGLAAARKTGLAAARGRYVLQVDSDDYLEPTLVEKLLAAAEGEGADIAVCDYFVDYARRTVTRSETVKTDGWGEMNLLLRAANPSFVWNKLIRRSLLTDHAIAPVEGLDMLEDRAQLFRIFYFARRVAHVREPLYHYVFNPASITSVMSDKSVGDMRRLLDEVDAFYRTEQITDAGLLESRRIQELSIASCVAFYGGRHALRLLDERALRHGVGEIMRCPYLSLPLRLALLAQRWHCPLIPALMRRVQTVYRSYRYAR